MGTVEDGGGVVDCDDVGCGCVDDDVGAGFVVGVGLGAVGWVLVTTADVDAVVGFGGVVVALAGVVRGGVEVAVGRCVGAAVLVGDDVLVGGAVVVLPEVADVGSVVTDVVILTGAPVVGPVGDVDVSGRGSTSTRSTLAHAVPTGRSAIAGWPASGTTSDTESHTVRDR